MLAFSNGIIALDSAERAFRTNQAPGEDSATRGRFHWDGRKSANRRALLLRDLHTVLSLGVLDSAGGGGLKEGNAKTDRPCSDVCEKV